MQTMELKRTKVAGKFSLHFTQFETFEVGDVKDHIVSLRKAEGKNINLGEQKFMDGA